MIADLADGGLRSVCLHMYFLDPLNPLGESWKLEGGEVRVVPLF